MTLDSMENMDFMVDKILSYSPNTATLAKSVVQTSRKRLNDLDSEEWVKGIKSVWIETSDHMIKVLSCGFDRARDN